MCQSTRDPRSIKVPVVPWLAGLVLLYSQDWSFGLFLGPVLRYNLFSNSQLVADTKLYELNENLSTRVICNVNLIPLIVDIYY